ncbi:Putative teichuronic acid biosynthesis glycosyltransferase TuaH [Rosistilla ulvae]|uniref:Teichuronic acid biosynthesis glycosyltransferase TuaH n=1 Tax=Rosistilla ulvae TaxID=1930277 RepID=A0A517M0C8_9BACT|nr:glycosyltransferase [Rosistilla ulvae]QDS88331.1 Putative teichuronic acid biosynthesis glycosyltransferase TuaH [Rosistilla ulvae]
MSETTNQLLVFSDDWGRHPSSCQHLVGELLPELSATWVNTVGMRPPRWDRMTVARGAEKLHQWLSAADQVSAAPLPAALAIRNPTMWPWMSHRWDQALNAQLLTRQLHDVSDGAIAVTTIPIVADLVGRLPVRRWVYYCVDDFSVWPGLSANAMRMMERSLLEKVDCVVAASENLADAIRPLHPNVSILTHGVDCDFWAKPTGEPPAEIASLPGPLAVFWGVVDRRMNAEWVLALADRINSGTIVLAGPQQDPDPRLLLHPRIAAIGPVPFAQLPALARQASVLIMPYADLPVTRAMQPLKLKEYLATGVPVVAASLPAVSDWRDCLEMVTNKQEFVAATIQAMQQREAGSSKRIERLAARLASESWQAKAAQFRTRILPTS